MRKKRIILGAGFVSVGLLMAASVAPMQAKLIYNPSASAPKGFYWIGQKTAFKRGDFVAAFTPKEAQKLASGRGYLPENLPVLKSIYGIEGDRICIENGTVFINGRRVVDVLESDSYGRQMPIHEGCFQLQAGEFFLLSTQIPNSFDSRYFGPVGEDRILGVATPLAVFVK
ncbi:conjugative transfer signal peptidase TraF [Hyphococcus sp.]|uniref:conjugative transfer signal peptidase TraF n=1 Tax=Hyphococcus sp. TaxID=2038636 RepID=UPI003CCC1645